MQSASTMKTDDACSISATATVYPASLPFEARNDMNIHINETTDLPDFEIPDEVECNKKQEAEKEDSKKYRKVPSLASDTLIANKKTIISFVGPSKLYIVMKGMKLDDTEVKTITFLGRVSQLDIERYMARRPNVMKVIMDSYGPVS